MPYSITTEDLPDDRDLLIPVCASIRGDTVDITCFEEFSVIAKEYGERYSTAPLSDAALGSLFFSLDPIMKSRGYAMPDDRFEIDWVGVLERAPEPGGVVSLNAIDAAPYENLTGIDLAEAAELHQEAYVCIAEGKVVSVAVENFAEDGYVEIACETAEAYRSQGCAYSACAALCRDIIVDGYSVRWQCSADNAASVALAEKLGFEEIGSEMYMCYFNGENEE